VRDLVSAAKARELLKVVRMDPATASNASWKERAATYADGLRSGAAERYTEILQGLMYRTRVAKLSSQDRHAPQVARGYFVGEISVALDRPAREIEAELDGEAVAS
jgi:RNA polymerase-interacting CarD/CdnL/TRCF family regulator